MKKQPYVVLARKYRPQGFEEVLGQPAVSVTLKNALASKRLAHAYLFTGPRGVGKTTMARILAKALNCSTGPTPEPCGECVPCREIALSSSLDVLEMDAASHTGVDNVREVIIDTVGLAPSRDRYKVFIIDEAHMLSTAAFNALLKTLEEPPGHAVFILATTEAAKIPATIASRCQRFKFRPIPPELLARHLGDLAKKEKIDIAPEALELLARGAEGSLRDAVSLLDQSRSFTEGRVTEGLIREMFGLVPQEMLKGVAETLLARDPLGLGRWLEKINEEGVEPAQLLRDLRAALEGVYLEKLGLGEPADKAWAGAAQGAAADAVAFLLRRVNKTLEDLRFADSPRLTLELGLYGCLEAAADLGAWIERLERLERRLSSGEVVAEAPEAARSEASPERPQGAGGDPLPSLLAALNKEKPSLAAALGSARLLPGPGGAWKLVFPRAFDLDLAKRSLPAIVAILATIVGGEPRLSLELGPAAQKGPAEAPDPAPSETGGEASAAGGWKDVAPRGEQPAPPASLKKAAQILGGKIRIVKRPA